MAKLSLAQRLDKLDGKLDGRIHWQGIEKYLRRFVAPSANQEVNQRLLGKKNKPPEHQQSYLSTADADRASGRKGLRMSLLSNKYATRNNEGKYNGLGLEELAQSIIFEGTGGRRTKKKLKAGISYKQFYKQQYK